MHRDGPTWWRVGEGGGGREEGGKRVTQTIAQIEEENSRGRATLSGGNGKFAAVREKPKIQSLGVPPLDGKISPQTSPSIGLKSEYHRFGGTLRRKRISGISSTGWEFYASLEAPVDKYLITSPPSPSHPSSSPC